MADDRFNYMLLDRLRRDREQKQIDKMRELYDSLHIKPEWLTKEQIEEFAAKMGPNNNQHF